MQKIIRTISAVFFSLVIFSPYLVLAADPLVPTCDPNCGFNELITLVNNIIKWAIMIAPMLAALTFAYAGFLYITAGGSPEKKSEANRIFFATVAGLIIVLAAWLIVNAILSGLKVDGVYNLLKK